MKKHYKMIALVVSVLTVVTWAFAHPYNVPGDCMERCNRRAYPLAGTAPRAPP